MVQLKLTLKSNRPSTIYASNGKAYKLQPGSNTLNLEYDDYLALAKTLLIKPVLPKPADKKLSTTVDNKELESKVDKNENEESPEQDEKPVDNICKSEYKKESEKESESKNTEDLKESHVEDSANESFEHDETHIDKSAEEASDDTCESHTEESDEHLDDEVVDYSTWSYTDLKAKYKEVTGKSCKLKKDEIISFLQEHSKDA